MDTIKSENRFEELPPSPPLAPASPTLSSSASSSSSATFHDVTDQTSSCPRSADATEALASETSPSAPAKKRSSAGAVQGEEDSDDEGEDFGDPDDSVWYTPSQLREIITRSTTLKEEGNRAFGKGDLERAVEVYREALLELPVRTRPPRSSSPARDDDVTEEEGEVDGASFSKSNVKGKGKEEEEKVPSLLSSNVKGEADEDVEGEKEASELRSVLNANIGACYLRLKNWKEAVTACTEALEENPDYVKALSRRATANEEIGTWSSLTAALEDHKRLVTISSSQPVPPHTVKASNQAINTRLPPLITAAQEKEKAEMIDKLKDLGNTVLGKFGLSTDNFKFTPQPGGGYSFNFER